MSDTGYINEKLALDFLNHFIQYTKAGPDQPTKLLLMDNHNSHITANFINLGLQNNIVLFIFPGHLMHCIQPYDIRVFQAYEHWHNKTIQYTLENLDFEYTISSFFRDLK